MADLTAPAPRHHDRHVRPDPSGRRRRVHPARVPAGVRCRPARIAHRADPGGAVLRGVGVARPLDDTRRAGVGGLAKCPPTRAGGDGPRPAACAGTAEWTGRFESGDPVTEAASNTTPAPQWPELGTVLVIIPTYNEAENIEPIVERLRAAVPEADILIADDNSPDGTGRLADGLADADDHVHVLHRPAKQGLGATYVAGFRWGLERGYGVLVEHDADGSHQPEQLPSMLQALRTADMVKGSRWVKGGSVVN